LTDEKRFTERIRNRATEESRLIGRASDRSRWAEVLKHRWPTALGVAVAGLNVLDLKVDAGFVSSFSTLVIVMALVYVGAAALGRRRISWAVLLAGLPLAFFVPPGSWVSPSVVLLGASALFLAVGTAQGRLREPGGLTLQAAGVLVFGVIALTALFVAPELGAYLVAFALLGHAGWDAYHYLRDRVVARSYAEFCGVLDFLLGTTILVVA
jgi:hypothetical protein